MSRRETINYLNAAIDKLIIEEKVKGELSSKKRIEMQRLMKLHSKVLAAR